MDIKKIGVIGAGTMGATIAFVFARSGFDVRLIDISDDVLTKALARVKSIAETLKRGGLMGETEPEETFSRLVASTDAEGAAMWADFVLEAVPERLEIKADLFRSLDARTDPDTILASNTSGISITRIASAARRAERVVGMHWWNPPHIIPVIEIIKGDATSAETVHATASLARTLGKKPVLVKKDVPGFLGNRMQYALMREAIHLLEEGVASAEDIDTMVREGFGFKFPVMGPLETIDMAGLDIFANVAGYLYSKLDSSKETPQAVLDRVRRGELGLKKGRGFYDYSNADLAALAEKRERLLLKILELLRSA